MKNARRRIALTLALALSAGAAVTLGTTTAGAQTAAAPATTAPAAMAAPKAAKPRTAQSIACSGKADAQNLHGKPRKTFMSNCKSGKM